MTDRLHQAARKALAGDISREDYYRLWRAVMAERLAAPSSGPPTKPMTLSADPTPSQSLPVEGRQTTREEQPLRPALRPSARSGP